MPGQKTIIDILLKKGLRDSIEEASAQIPTLTSLEKMRLRERIMTAVRRTESRGKNRPDSGNHPRKQ